MNLREVAIAALDHTLARCETATDEDFILELQKLVGLCRQDPLLLSVLKDCDSRLGRKADAFIAVLGEAEASALQLGSDLDRDFPDLRTERKAGTATGMPEPFARALSLEAFDNLAAASRTSPPSLDRLGEMFRILSWQISVIQNGQPSLPSTAVPLKKRLTFLEEQAEWFNRDRQNLILTDPGACWYELRKRDEQINPGPVFRDGPIDMQALLESALRSLGDPPIEKMLYGHRPGSGTSKPTTEERARFLAWRRALQTRLKRFRDDLVYLLQSAASRDTLVRRYTARCMWFRREELRQAATSATSAKRRRAEKVLAADAATYLFDQGLFVLTEVNLAPLRLDIIGDSGDQLLLIEAKIYGEGGEGRDVVAKGLAQLLDYAASLTAAGLAPIAYLFVYRIGGRRVDFPQGPFEAHGRTVEIAQIDLAPADVSGSKAPAPIAFSREALLERMNEFAPHPAKRKRAPAKSTP